MDKKNFDNIIKNNLIKSGYDKFGYEMTKTYYDYYTFDSFTLFVKDMEENYPDIYRKYKDGKGQELFPTIKPPKMASVGSSSRFCYLALRNGATALGGNGKVVFEYEQRIHAIKGTAPQLDAHVDNIYVECKCHEMFDAHKTELSIQYWNHIYGENNGFGLPVKNRPEISKFNLSPSDFGINTHIHMFDFKQFLCHLLGIASRENKDEDATLVYLFFKPAVEDEKVQNDINTLFCNLEKEISSVFNCSPVQTFIKNHSINLKAVAQESTVMTDLTADNIITLY